MPPPRLSLRPSAVARLRPFSTTTAATTPPPLPPPRWLADLQARLGRCLMFGCSREQTRAAGAVLGALAAEWRGLVAGSEGFLTGRPRPRGPAGGVGRDGQLCRLPTLQRTASRSHPTRPLLTLSRTGRATSTTSSTRATPSRPASTGSPALRPRPGPPRQVDRPDDAAGSWPYAPPPLPLSTLHVRCGPEPATALPVVIVTQLPRARSHHQEPPDGLQIREFRRVPSLCLSEGRDGEQQQ